MYSASKIVTSAGVGDFSVLDVGRKVYVRLFASSTEMEIGMAGSIGKERPSTCRTRKASRSLALGIFVCVGGELMHSRERVPVTVSSVERSVALGSVTRM